MAQVDVRRPREEVLAVAEKVRQQLLSMGLVYRAELAGSIRRLEDEIGDVDMVVIPTSGFEGWQRATLGSAKNGKASRRGLIEGVLFDFYVTTEDAWGAALLHATGPRQRNIAYRVKAKKMGMALNENGLWKLNPTKNGGVDEFIAGRTERDVVTALGCEWREPKDR